MKTRVSHTVFAGLAQGKGDVAAMKWLERKQCDLYLVNNNGHGVLHKAAQRGQQDICSWFLENSISKTSALDGLKLVGPDTEGYCPSDLAGMEGFETLARMLASSEIELVSKFVGTLSINYPEKEPHWLFESTQGVTDIRITEKEKHTWERFGGLRRMRYQLRCCKEGGKW